MTTQDRRSGGEVDVRAPVQATLVFRLRGEEIELDATVVGATENTLVVELASGAGTLALATARRCELVLSLDGEEVRAQGRPGRRVGDIPLNNRIELVVTDGLDIASLF